MRDHACDRVCPSPTGSTWRPRTGSIGETASIEIYDRRADRQPADSWLPQAPAPKPRGCCRRPKGGSHSRRAGLQRSTPPDRGKLDQVRTQVSRQWGLSARREALRAQSSSPPNGPRARGVTQCRLQARTETKARQGRPLQSQRTPLLDLLPVRPSSSSRWHWHPGETSPTRPRRLGISSHEVRGRGREPPIGFEVATISSRCS